MIDFKNCNEYELWQYVATHLVKNGIDTVLVGGAVVSIYSKGAYRSGDLDFVMTDLFVKDLKKRMKEIGFEQKGSRHYVHPECTHIFIEFVSGPIEIGEEVNVTPDEIESDGTVIKVLSPTDCVKDRLASYIYFKSRECLDQAILVAKAQSVSYDKIKKWCEGEKRADVFDEFLSLLKEGN